jgi:hypothetical protein
MNIFVIEHDAVKSAISQCDKHIVKMVLESAQLLCSVFPKGIAPYRISHFNHPCSKWVRYSSDNFNWLVTHAIALSDEYTYRYGKVHASLKVIEWCRQNIGQAQFTDTGFTTQPLCMPDQYKVNDVVQSYRNYYLNDKRPIAKWTKRNPPDWWV